MSPLSRTRVLVVDDSLSARKRVVEVLTADPTFEVLAEAADGREAIELCERLRPDVVTMDMLLPVMSGLAATEWIMAYCPTPIIVLSGALATGEAEERGEAFHSYDAIAAGAVDMLAKPTAREFARDWDERLKFRLRVASRVKVVTHVRGRRAPSLVPVAAPRAAASTAAQVVVIGASTGGPSALRRILMALQRDFPLPMLVVMHIGEPFDVALADWLDAQTAHRVRVAVDGESLLGGPPGVRMAPAGVHAVVSEGRIRLRDGPERHSCRPSIDVLFESVASDVGEGAIGVLLTGMGRDGAAGLHALRCARAHTIAQDEASSVIYGMPRVAVELGAATSVLSVDAIAPALERLTSRRGKK